MKKIGPSTAPRSLYTLDVVGNGEPVGILDQEGLIDL
jgi:hypothetical protein